MFPDGRAVLASKNSFLAASNFIPVYPFVIKSYNFILHLMLSHILFSEFYVHGTVHLSSTSHINTNKMQLFLNSLLFGVRTLHVSDAVCVHHQEYYKL